ncbi:MAG: hypothetical protein AAB133_07485, partial [Pseudomonadota bacterium]
MALKTFILLAQRRYRFFIRLLEITIDGFFIHSCRQIPKRAMRFALSAFAAAFATLRGALDQAIPEKGAGLQQPLIEAILFSNGKTNLLADSGSVSSHNCIIYYYTDMIIAKKEGPAIIDRALPLLPSSEIYFRFSCEKMKPSLAGIVFAGAAVVMFTAVVGAIPNSPTGLSVSGETATSVSLAWDRSPFECGVSTCFPGVTPDYG